MNDWNLVRKIYEHEKFCRRKNSVPGYTLEPESDSEEFEDSEVVGEAPRVPNPKYKGLRASEPASEPEPLRGSERSEPLGITPEPKKQSYADRLQETQKRTKNRKRGW